MLSLTPLLSVVILVLSSINGISATNIIRQAPAPPPSSPTLTFKPQSTQITTCNSATFAWDYSGPDLRMSLYVTNRGVTQLDPPILPSSLTPSPTTTAPLGAVSLMIALSAFEGLAPIHDTSYTWTSVALPRGWYVLEAELRAANYTARGAPFFVEELGDNACLQVMAPHPTSGTSRQFYSYPNKAVMFVGILGIRYLSALVGN